MIVLRRVLACDGDGCHAQFPADRDAAGFSMASEARRSAAVAQGWVFTLEGDGKDYCKGCWGAKGRTTVEHQPPIAPGSES